MREMEWRGGTRGRFVENEERVGKWRVEVDVRGVEKDRESVCVI
jgi:hypothetical protein